MFIKAVGYVLGQGFWFSFLRKELPQTEIYVFSNVSFYEISLNVNYYNSRVKICSGFWEPVLSYCLPLGEYFF